VIPPWLGHILLIAIASGLAAGGLWQFLRPARVTQERQRIARAFRSEEDGDRAAAAFSRRNTQISGLMGAVFGAILVVVGVVLLLHDVRS